MNLAIYYGYEIEMKKKKKNEKKTADFGRAWFETKNILLFLIHLIINVLL